MSDAADAPPFEAGVGEAADALPFGDDVDDGGERDARSVDVAAEYLDLPGHSRAQRFLLRWIDRYRRAFAGRPSPCRFFPTCSEYGADAIHLHGAGRGSWLTVRRLLRCRPLGPSGYDPVPLPDHPET